VRSGPTKLDRDRISRKELPRRVTCGSSSFRSRVEGQDADSRVFSPPPAHVERKRDGDGTSSIWTDEERKESGRDARAGSSGFSRPGEWYVSCR